jgi:hypothetical protein
MGALIESLVGTTIAEALYYTFYNNVAGCIKYHEMTQRAIIVIVICGSLQPMDLWI